MDTVCSFIYLDTGGTFERMLQIAGRIFFALELIFIVVNIFTPVLFWFDESGVYQAGIARHITLGIQIFMFLVASRLHTLCCLQIKKAESDIGT